MILFIKLMLAHLLGDFIFQPSSWVKEKEIHKWRSNKLYLHVFIHAVLTYLLICLITHKPDLFYIPVVILISHFIIDMMKLSFQKNSNQSFWFFLDQTLHLTIIIGICLYENNNLIASVKLLDSPQTLSIVTAVILLTTPSSLFIKFIVNKWAPEIEETTDSSIQSTSLYSAGKFIGILERLFVFSFILLNHLEAIGFLIAAKSLLRFGDLKKEHERKLTEYVLIGTLLSFGIAIIIGVSTRKFLTGI